MAEYGIFRILNDSLYRKWINEFDTPSSDELQCVGHKIKELPTSPSIAILPLAVGGINQKQFSAFAYRFERQLYQNWRIYSPRGFEHAKRSMIVTGLEPSENLFLKAAETADFVLPLPLDAVLRPHALATLVLALAKVPDADMLYGDEDFLQRGRRLQPHFKTGWDPFLILGCNFTGLPILYRADALRRAALQGLSSITVDNLLHAVTLRVSEVTSKSRILHIPSILCHRTRKSDWSGEEARRLVAAHLARHSLVVDLSPAPLAPIWNRVRFALPAPPPFVSIIIPTRDRVDLISRCADGLLNHTDYPSFELIIVDNGTTEVDALNFLNALKNEPRVRILRDDRPFNYSRLNNSAAEIARGDVLILLNNDIEILKADWLAELVSLASRSDVGAVGAKLLYPDLRIQHAGVSFGPDKLVVHQMRHATAQEAGHRGELALLRSTSAVTAACLALRRSVYFEVGGLDEKNLKIACNDIDLCRRIAKHGLAIVWTPFAEMMHHESATRGQPITPEKADREETEIIAFWSMHPELYEVPDPFHNPQIEFKHDCVDFARPPRFHPLRPEIKERRAFPFLY